MHNFAYLLNCYIGTLRLAIHIINAVERKYVQSVYKLIKVRVKKTENQMQ